MSYETALQWALDHLPPQDFDSFNDWYRQVSNKMNTPNLMSNPTFNNMLEKAWMEITGTDSEDNPIVIQRTPSKEREIQMPINPRIYVAPSKELEKKQEVIALPQTGRAPEIPRPILVFPKEQIGRLQRVKNFFSGLSRALTGAPQK